MAKRKVRKTAKPAKKAAVSVKRGPSPALAAVSIIILVLAVAAVFYVFSGSNSVARSSCEIMFDNLNNRTFFVDGKQVAKQKILWNGYPESIIETKGEIPDGTYKGYLGKDVKVLLTQETYQKGKLNGRYKLYSLGLLVEGLYKDGKKDGVWVRNTRGKDYDTYKDGVPDGRFERSDETMRVKGWHTKGKLDGVCDYFEKYKVLFFTNECLVSKKSYKLDVKDGISRFYQIKKFLYFFKTPVIEHVESWKNGKMDGEFRFYDKSGALTSISKYKNGVITENKLF